MLGIIAGVPLGAVAGCRPPESGGQTESTGSSTGGSASSGDGTSAGSSGPDPTSTGSTGTMGPGTTGPGTTDPGTTDPGTTDPGTTDPGTTGPGDVPAEQHLCSRDYPRIDLKADCGAIGDGVTNDTAAFQKAATILEEAGGGELTIPAGVYIVGKQTKKTDPDADPNQGPFYEHASIFTVSDLACLKVSGYGAKLRVADGLHYGGFDPDTGEPAPWMNSQTPERAAQVGRILELTRCGSVLIEGLELDGNNESLVIGGQYGNEDIQGAATGISLNMCQDVTIVDVHTHHHGLDGITVRYSDGPPPQKMPHTLTNVVSEYNGRQGLSWIGGWGLYCTDCKFNHTGRAINNGQPFGSKPLAGLDIEPNAGTEQVSRESVFTNCEFINNRGNGVEASNGESSDHTFVGCTIWGTTIYSIWAVKPGMTFENCKIHGTFVRGHATMKFTGCTIEDKEWDDGNVYRANSLIALDGYDGMTWTGCTFVAHKVRGIFVGNVATNEVFDSCTFVHGHAALSNGTYHSNFIGCTIKSCRFEESAEVSGGTKEYFIRLEAVQVAAPDQGDPATQVVGPQIRWGSVNGATGDIAPGNYG